MQTVAQRLAGRRKRPPSSSTPLPPLREDHRRIGSSSGLTINLPHSGRPPGRMTTFDSSRPQRQLWNVYLWE